MMVSVEKVTTRVHPVVLDRVVFPNFSLKRRERVKTPLRFPELSIKGLKILPDEESKDSNVAYIEIFLENEKGQRNIPVEVKVTCIAKFICLNEEKTDEIFKAFFSRESAYVIVWPYIREFVTGMIQKSGLPEYYLPLSMTWNIEGDEVVADIKHSK